METEFADLLSKYNFKIVGKSTLDENNQDKAFILKCNKCGKLFVRSYKQLESGSLSVCSCLDSLLDTEVYKSFVINKYEGYTIIQSIEQISGKKNDFVIISNDYLDSVLDLLKSEENTSIQSIWMRNQYTYKLFGSFVNMYFKNGVCFDFRLENLVITRDLEEDKVVSIYLDKNHRLRSQYNITKRYCDSDGFNHGIVYHIAGIVIPDENGCYKMGTDEGKKVFYFKNDIAAARMMYKLEEKYFHNENIGLDAYHIMNDYSGDENTELFLRLMKLEIDISYAEYVKLSELAEINPLMIFRYGLEDMLLSYGIPCTVYFDMYPFDDKHIRGSNRVHRKNDYYILKWGRFDSESKLKPKELIRCIVGHQRNIDFDLFRVNGTLKKMSFQEALDTYGSLDCDYNDENGVLEKYTKEIVGYSPRQIDKSSIKVNNDDKLKMFNNLFSK